IIRIARQRSGNTGVRRYPALLVRCRVHGADDAGVARENEAREVFNEIIPRNSHYRAEKWNTGEYGGTEILSFFMIYPSQGHI
ncbi:unnamed protein product, partial [Darwinula stevensoni]